MAKTKYHPSADTLIQKIATFQISKQYQKIIGENRDQKAEIVFRKV
jgi:hypothetical protein